MAAFEYRQAELNRGVFDRHRVKYLFVGKAGAIILGYPETTQEVGVFPLMGDENGRRLVDALREAGFNITDERASEIRRGKDFV
jgi:hypothetical protein